MLPRIDALKHDVLRFVPATNKALTKQVNELFVKLRKLNAANFDAILPIEPIDMHAQQIEWSNMSYGEDYETSCTYTYQDPITGSYEEVTPDERTERLEKVEEAIDACKSAKKLAKLEELKSAIEDAEPEYAELMWNTSWQPWGRDVDKSIAESVPQVTWVEKLTDMSSDTHDRNGDPIEGCGAEAGTYLTLTCIGQDNGPALMAYTVLAHGVVPAGDERYWTRDRGWTEHVIGRSCFLACARKLGVEKELKAAFKADAKQAKLRAEEQKRREAEQARIRVIPFSKPLGTALLEAFKEDEYRTFRDAGNYVMKVVDRGQQSLQAKHPLLVEFELHHSGYEYHTRLREVLISKGLLEKPKDD